MRMIGSLDQYKWFHVSTIDEGHNWKKIIHRKKVENKIK